MINLPWCLYWLLYTGHQGTIQTLLNNLVIFLSELVLAADKVLIVFDFNSHVDNEKDAFGSVLTDITDNSQRVSVTSVITVTAVISTHV